MLRYEKWDETQGGQHIEHIEIRSKLLSTLSMVVTLSSRFRKSPEKRPTEVTRQEILNMEIGSGCKLIDSRPRAQGVGFGILNLETPNK